MSEEPLGAALGSGNTGVLGGGEEAVGNQKKGHSGVPSPPPDHFAPPSRRQPLALAPSQEATLRAPGLLPAPATY
jgi:hypothetical protein